MSGHDITKYAEVACLAFGRLVIALRNGKQTRQIEGIQLIVGHLLMITFVDMNSRSITMTWISQHVAHTRTMRRENEIMTCSNQCCRLHVSRGGYSCSSSSLLPSTPLRLSAYINMQVTALTVLTLFHKHLVASPRPPDFSLPAPIAKVKLTLRAPVYPVVEWSSAHSAMKLLSSFRHGPVCLMSLLTMIRGSVTWLLRLLAIVVGIAVDIAVDIVVDLDLFVGEVTLAAVHLETAAVAELTAAAAPGRLLATVWERQDSGLTSCDYTHPPSPPFVDMLDTASNRLSLQPA